MPIFFSNNSDFSCQTQQAENELQLLESEMLRLNTEIHLKDSRIKELETKFSRIEDALIIKPHKQLSAVCVENMNVPPVAPGNNCECRMVQSIVQADDVARMKERECDDDVYQGWFLAKLQELLVSSIMI